MQTVLPTTGLNAPTGMAIDYAGNLYIADTGNNRVVEITTAGVQETVLTGTVAGAALKAPRAVAVDASFDLYVADSGNNRVLEITPQGTASTIGTGLSNPSGIALTGSVGSIIIADTGNDRLVSVVQGTRQYTLAGGAGQAGGISLAQPLGVALAEVSEGDFILLIADTGNNRVIYGNSNAGITFSSTLLIEGLNNPAAVTFARPVFQAGFEAPYGDFYAADTGNGRVLGDCNFGEVEASVSSGISSPGGLAADSAGNVYIADSSANRIWKLATGESANFGSVKVGSEVTLPLTFAFLPRGEMSAPALVTQGAPNLDFTSTNSGSCKAGTYYSSASNCTIDVTFRPTAAGQRDGALSLTGGAFEYIGDNPDLFLSGVGVGPQIVYDPGVQTTLAAGFNDPRGIAVDGSGNVFVADFGDGQIVKTNPAGVKSDFVPLNAVSSLSIDSAGSLEAVGDGSGLGNEAIFVITPAGAVSSPLLFYDYGVGVAVDPSGNFFVADIQISDVVESGFAVKTALYYGGGFRPSAVAVDGNGNLFIVDSTDWLVWKVTPAREWSTVGSGYNRPAGIAVDDVGNVYVADFGNNRVVKVTPAGVQSEVGTGLSEPTAVAVARFGNIFIADFGNSRVVKVDRSGAPPIAFAKTAVGKTSSDSPRTVMIENAGNAPLTFAVPTTGTNPSLSANFTLGSATTCPVLSSTSNPAALAAGATCTYEVSFTPTAAGAIKGSLVMTDNNLNGVKATQTIALSGKATAAGVKVTWAAPAPIPAGTALSTKQLDATASVPGKFAYSPDAGTRLAKGTHALTTTFTPADAGKYQAASAKVELVVE